jgi:hypothetical protein
VTAEKLVLPSIAVPPDESRSDRYLSEATLSYRRWHTHITHCTPTRNEESSFDTGSNGILHGKGIQRVFFVAIGPGAALSTSTLRLASSTCRPASVDSYLVLYTETRQSRAEQ